MATPTEAELTQEVKDLRQLLQAGVMLVSSVLAGEDVRADLREWVDAVAAAARD
ncbi:MAG: hypothetical protein AAF721_06965 [Myxococcota bacterium]